MIVWPTPRLLQEIVAKSPLIFFFYHDPTLLLTCCLWKYFYFNYFLLMFSECYHDMKVNTHTIYPDPANKALIKTLHNSFCLAYLCAHCCCFQICMGNYCHHLTWLEIEPEVKIGTKHNIDIVKYCLRIFVIMDFLNWYLNSARWRRAWSYIEFMWLRFYCCRVYRCC